MIRFYSDGVLYKTKSYDVSGCLTSVENYKNGFIHGRCHLYNHGVKYAVQTYKRGRLCGKTTIFNEDGSINEIHYYNANLLTKIVYYDKKPIGETIFANGKIIKDKCY